MFYSDFCSPTSLQSSELCTHPPPENAIKMPLVRRRRPLLKLSSSPVDTVDAQGIAYLCFPEDHSWFQGNISTDDESNYSLYGERINMPQEDQTQEKKDDKVTGASSDNGSDDVSPEDETDYYRVTMIDHFSGQKNILPTIIITGKRPGTASPTSPPDQLFTSKHGEVTFMAENVYKGQKADIMIQRFLGASPLVGKKCLLYSGQINILFNDVSETGRSWSL